MLDLYAHPPAGSRVLCLDEFGPLNLQPRLGHGWQPMRHPARFRATYKRTAGVRHLLAAYDPATGRLYGHIRATKTWREVRELLRTLRARFTEHLIVVLDNFSPHHKRELRDWVVDHDFPALRARGLVVETRGRLVPTVAGVLVPGRDPQAYFPEADVRLLRYKGSSRETGARSNVLQDVRLTGTIPDQIATARRRLRRWLPATVRLGTRGRFDRETYVPESAWLEAIMNAVIHRSYAIGGDHIRVELFDDRLEIESPGRLPGLVRIDNIRTARFARNPRIARALADLDYGRELGEGVNRMYEER